MLRCPDRHVCHAVGKRRHETVDVAQADGAFGDQQQREGVGEPLHRAVFEKLVFAAAFARSGDPRRLAHAAHHLHDIPLETRLAEGARRVVQHVEAMRGALIDDD